MQRKFISNLALMMVLNLIVKPIAIFGIDATVQNRVGAEDYGIYFSLLNFSLLFNILLDLGINNFTTKHIAQYPAIATKYLGKVISIRFALLLFYAVFSYSIAFILGWNNYELYLLGILLLNQFLVTMIAFARSHFGGYLMFKTDAFVSVLDRLLLIIICGYLLFIPNSLGTFDIEWFIWVQTICYAITLVVSVILLYKRIRLPKITYQHSFTMSILRKSLPYALLILLMTVYTRTDSIMIERIHENGASESGYYAQGFRLLNALFMFAMLFSNLLFPLFSSMLGKAQDVRPLFLSSTKLLMGGSILIGILCYFNGEYILNLIYKSDTMEAARSFKWILLSFIGMSGIILFGTYLTAKGDLRYLNLTSLAGIAVNFGLNYTLIPEYGAEGAAIATVVTQSLIALLQLIRCIQVMPLQLSLLEISKYIIFTGIIGLLFWYFRIENLWELVALTTSGLLFMAILGFIPVRSFISMIANRQNN